jgi:hypothetical protein
MRSNIVVFVSKKELLDRLHTLTGGGNLCYVYSILVFIFLRSLVSKPRI